MEDGRTNRTTADEMPDTVFECVINYIHDARDRDAVSQVCRRWYEVDKLTRKQASIALCYKKAPQQLWRRFKHLESLKLKGRPRSVMFTLIPKEEDWGGHVTPWAEAIASSFGCLKSLHFRRMIVRDSDLELFTRTRGQVLVELKLDKCSGFSTDGLLCVGRSCRSLRTLFLEESIIEERDGEWLHQLALNNTVLESLNFYLTDLGQIRFKDLELIARNCHFLVSVKISQCELLDLVGFFSVATALEEFAGGSVSDQPQGYSSITFPPKLRCLGLTNMGRNELPIVFPCASLLRRLDLLYALLDTEDICLLIQRCPSLEVLETKDVVGDRGLQLLASCCKKLRRLHIERGPHELHIARGAHEQGMGHEGSLVSHRGLITLAQGCLDLEYIAVYVSDITNACLGYIGTYLKNLSDFRLILLNHEEMIADLPLDNGVRALLQGCHKLSHFALCLRPGGLTDVGLGFIGRYSPNVRWMHLRSIGHSNEGLLEFSRGCPSLQRLELCGCRFSEDALARAVLQLHSLKCLWVHGYKPSDRAHELWAMAMARPLWRVMSCLQ